MCSEGSCLTCRRQRRQQRYVSLGLLPLLCLLSLLTLICWWIELFPPQRYIIKLILTSFYTRQTNIVAEMPQQNLEFLCGLLLVTKFFSFPQKHGLVIIPDSTPNGDVNHEPVVGAITAVSQEAAQVLESAGEGPLGERLLAV